MFEYFIHGLDQKTQATLNYMYAHSRAIDEINHRREMEQMKEEVVREVLAQLSVSVDIGDALQQIEELRKALDSLTNIQ